MATTTPLAYNTGSTISGTIQVGNLAVGTTVQDYSSNLGGVTWWMGPNEELGYVIAKPISGNTQPTPILGNNIYLSPTYKGTDINLSNNNQTAYQQFGYQQSVLGITPIGSGDTSMVMFSILCTLADPPALPGSHFVGIGYTTMNYQGNPYGGFPGNDNQSMGYGSDGTIWYNGSVYVSGFDTWGNNDIIDIVINNSVNTMWVRVNGGDWDNNPSDNPATNTGGFETIGGPFYPVLCPAYEGTMTIQNKPSFGVPSGYLFLGNTLASVGFNRSELTDISFINLTNGLFNQSFTSATESSVWLTNNGYWNSYGINGGNGLTPETAGDNAFQIKTDFPSSQDGLYWIKNNNISGGTPFQIYADMTTDGGGWTLLLTNQNTAGWTYSNAILLNEFNPVSGGSNYSIVTYADYLKSSGATFQYMIDAYQRNQFGGIWSAPSSYTFLNPDNTQTSITLDIKFGTWNYNDASIEQHMPWYSNNCGVLTTSENPGGEWWGTLVSQCGFSPSPWINGDCGLDGCMPNPGIIWYWVR